MLLRNLVTNSESLYSCFYSIFKVMKYSDIQRIVIVYGTKDRIKTFLESNVQAIEEDTEEKINLREIKNNSHSLFKTLKHFIWKSQN